MAGNPEQHVWILRNQLTECNKALEDEMALKTEYQTENNKLTAKVRTQREEYAKLEKHVKECERAATKAQIDAKNAKGGANHQVNSQKGQLKNAERRFTEASHLLKQWTDTYGSVIEKPAQDMQNLQERLFELQSNAEIARNQIASLEAQVQGTPEQIGLHQALEQWQEHQGCSTEFRDLEDKVHDGIVDKQKLESDLKASKERCQKAKADLKGLQIKMKQLQQANNALEKLQRDPDQLQQFIKEFQELQVKANQLEQTNKALQGQDKPHEYTLQIQKLESDIKASTEKTHEYMLYSQKLESDIKASTEKTHEYMLYSQKLESDIKASKEETEKAQSNWQNLEDQIAAQLAKDDDLSTFADNVDDVLMLDRDLLEKDRLESEFRALQMRHQKTESDLNALQGHTYQVEQANQAFRDQNKSLTDMLQKLQLDQQESQQRSQENESNRNALQQNVDQLESELKSTKEQYQTTKAGMDALQEHADRLNLHLNAATEQYQTTKSNMEALQEYADRLKFDLNAATEQYQTTKSNMEALQGKGGQLEQANKTLHEKGVQVESDLKTTKEQHQATKSNLDALQGRASQLESDLRTTKEQHQFAKSNMDAVQAKAKQLESDLKTAQTQHRTTKSQLEALQGKADQLEQANATQEKENKRLQTEITEKQEQYEKEKKQKAEAEQRGTLRVKTPEKAERSQGTPLSSPLYTTDEGSQDLETTPRPKKSLRQELGYSSRDHSDKEQDDVHMPQQQSVMMSNQATSFRGINYGPADFWDSDDGEDTRHLANLVPGREVRKLLKKRRGECDRAIREIREKEVSTILKNMFECPPEKANAIERRIRRIGPGALLGEAPAVVAYELSGIPVDTYKGLASGQLIATMPPNEVRDVGTNPEVFADDVSTHITDLRTDRVADPLYIAQDMGTDTADLPVEEVTTSHNRLSRQALFQYLMILLMILFGLFSLYRLYMGLFSNPSSETQHGTQYQTVYPYRHTPVPTPSVNYSTPITLVYPPTPAPQLGLVRMMMGSSLGRGLGGSKW